MKNNDYFAEWAKNKPLALAIYSHQIAYFADTIYNLLDEAKHADNETLSDIYPDLGTWLNFYKKHNSVVDYIFYLFNDPFDSIAGPRIFRYGNINNYLKFAKTVDSTLGKNVSKTETDQLWENCIDKKLNSPDAVFLFLVLLPCLLFYGKNPAQLLREARNKNFDSLEKLIRLDSSIIFEPRISKLIHNLKKQDIRTFQSLIKSIAKTPQAKVSKRRVKVLLAAQISQLSDDTGYRLTEPEIRKLFDLVAQESGLGDIDTDLPESSETFSKAIQRELSFWEISFQPDKK